MPVAASLTRSRGDACPGVLTVHPAADGALARVRLPGGLVSAAQFGALAAAARHYGPGGVELTSRGNVQLRGLAPGAEVELGGQLAAAGLLPSATHERVRNIVASPLAGIDRDSDLSATVVALDRALCARPRLAELPGRFLFALDDGRNDVGRLGADVLLQAGEQGWVAVGGLGVDSADAVEAMLAFAAAFLDERAAQGSLAWRVGELDDGPAAVRRRVLAAMSGARVLPGRPLPPPAREPAGVLEQHDGGRALAALAPLGRLTAGQLDALAGHTGARGARITPWRSVVLPDVADAPAAARELEALGLGVGPASPWYRVSACTGRPGCDRGLADVQADAGAEVRTAPRWSGRQVHWSGCARRCGRPPDTEVDVVATGSGYEIAMGAP